MLTELTHERLLARILPQREDARLAVVYWLYDSSCARPGNDGYVGVAFKHRLSSRLNEHRRSRFVDKQFEVKILLEDHVNSCFLYEWTLRPHANIGWNLAPGGARGSKLGAPKSALTRKKIGDANRGRARPDLSERNRVTNRERYKHEVTCPHCGRCGRGPTMLRYHFSNCRSAKVVMP